MIQDYFRWTPMVPLNRGANKLKGPIYPGTNIVYRILMYHTERGRQIIYIGHGEPTRLAQFVRNLYTSGPTKLMHTAAARYYEEGYDRYFPQGSLFCQHLWTLCKRRGELLEYKLIGEYIHRNRGRSIQGADEQREVATEDWLHGHPPPSTDKPPSLIAVECPRIVSTDLNELICKI